MISESDILAAFPDARPIRSIYQAADQDGYDGGWIEYDSETGSERWASTKERLKRSIAIFPDETN